MSRVHWNLTKDLELPSELLSYSADHKQKKSSRYQQINKVCKVTGSMPAIPAEL
jgi:hypothetical protein